MKESEKQVSVSRVPLNAGLGLPKFCTVKDMNFTGEIMHGELKTSDAYGEYYILDDGDCYKPETLFNAYGAIFLDNDPRVPNAEITGSACGVRVD